jgi:hypothetical protein
METACIGLAMKTIKTDHLIWDKLIFLLFIFLFPLNKKGYLQYYQKYADIEFLSLEINLNRGKIIILGSYKKTTAPHTTLTK